MGTIAVIVLTSAYYRLTNPPEYPAWNKELGMAVKTPYPGWAMGVSVVLLSGGFLPIPIVYLMRRLQCVRYDTDIHQASIKRVETTISTTGMIKSEELDEYHDGDEDDDDDQGLQ